jgi:hypothetical protein
MLKTWLQAKINLTAKIITLSLKNRTMYNSKGGCMAAKLGVRGSVQVARSGMSNSSTASSTDSFIPYEGREKLKIWNLDVENDPGWRLKNHLNDALYHGGDMALRRKATTLTLIFKAKFVLYIREDEAAKMLDIYLKSS